MKFNCPVSSSIRAFQEACNTKSERYGILYYIRGSEDRSHVPVVHQYQNAGMPEASSVRVPFPREGGSCVHPAAPQVLSARGGLFIDRPWRRIADSAQRHSSCARATV